MQAQYHAFRNSTTLGPLFADANSWR